MPKVISTQIRIDNSSNITYVLEKFNNGTYKIFTHQRNMTSGCYGTSIKKGLCRS